MRCCARARVYVALVCIRISFMLTVLMSKSICEALIKKQDWDLTHPNFNCVCSCFTSPHACVYRTALIQSFILHVPWTDLRLMRGEMSGSSLLLLLPARKWCGSMPSWMRGQGTRKLSFGFYQKKLPLISWINLSSRKTMLARSCHWRDQEGRQHYCKEEARIWL